MQAEFQVKVKVHWNASGTVEILDSSLEEENDMDEDSEEGWFFLSNFRRFSFVSECKLFFF